LLVDPFLMHSVGFVLSFAASAGIAVLAPRIADRIPGPRILAEAIGVALGAQIAVAPVLVAVFDGVPLIAIPANVAAAPFAGPLTVCGIVGGLVGGVVGGPVAAVASFPAFVCATAVRTIADHAARSPLMLHGGELLAGFAVIGGVTLWLRRARRATWRRAPARPSRFPLAVPAGRDGARPVVPDARDGDPEPHA
jgi:competence protein ComEC